MRTIARAILAGAFLFTPGSAADDVDTGEYLLETCRKASEIRSPERWNRDFCVGYVSGFVDGHARGAVDSSSAAFCLPEDATTGKIVTAVVRSLEAHPDTLTLPRADALAAALADRFPCPAR